MFLFLNGTSSEAGNQETAEHRKTWDGGTISLEPDYQCEYQWAEGHVSLLYDSMSLFEHSQTNT